MSQHFYSANYQGKQIMVLCVLDRPMQQYFLVIEYEELTDDITDEDAYIYSNLFDESSMQQELVYFQQKLYAFDIKLPKSMLDQVREDRLNNVGNRDVAEIRKSELLAPLRSQTLTQGVSATWRRFHQPEHP